MPMHLLRPRTAPAGVLLAAIALAIGGCTHVVDNVKANVPLKGTPTQKVLQTCVSNIYGNGLLPLGPARSECVQCIVNALGQLGFSQTAGESANALIGGVRLSPSQASQLDFACNQSQASD